MTVNLDKLETGDLVTYRDGRNSRVLLVNKVEGSQGCRVSTTAAKGVHYVCPDGRRWHVALDELDIVNVVKAGASEESEEALRFNDGKPPMAYLPLDLLDGAAKVMQYGAKKYGDSENFRKGYKDLTSPLSSLVRHVAELQRAILTQDKDGSKGHLIDGESKEGHIHHVMTSTLLLLHSMRLQDYEV